MSGPSVQPEPGESAHTVRGDGGAREAWAQLLADVRACHIDGCHGGRQLERLATARARCLGARFPVTGEAAAACACALLEMARTLPRAAAGAERNWHADSLLALAEQCGRLLERAA